MDDCRRRVGNELETVPGAWGRSGCDGDGYIGDLEKVSSKMVHGIAEADKALGHIAPLNVQRIDDTAREPQWPRGIQTVRNLESVEYRADVLRLQSGCSSAQVYFGTAGRQWSRPEDKTLRNARIPRMEPQRAVWQTQRISRRRTRRQTIKSYERERAVVLESVDADEDAGHEPPVSMESVCRSIPCVQPRPLTCKKEVSLANHSLKVSDR